MGQQKDSLRKLLKVYVESTPEQRRENVRREFKRQEAESQSREQGQNGSASQAETAKKC